MRIFCLVTLLFVVGCASRVTWDQIDVENHTRSVDPDTIKMPSDRDLRLRGAYAIRDVRREIANVKDREKAAELEKELEAYVEKFRQMEVERLERDEEQERARYSR